MKKGLAITLISILAVIAIALGALYITNNNDKTKQIDTLTAEKADQASQIEDLTADVADKVSQIEGLTADVTDKAVQIDTLTADVADKASQIEGLTADVADKAAQIDTLTANVADKATQIEGLTADAADKAAQIDTLTADVADKATQIEGLTADAADKAAQIDTLTANVADKASQIEELTADAADKAAQIDTLTADVADKISQIEVLNTDVADKAARIEGLEAEKNELNSQIDILSKDIVAKAAQIEVLTSTNASQAEQIESLNAEITEKTAQIEALNAAVSERDARITELTEAVEKSKNEAVREPGDLTGSWMAHYAVIGGTNVDISNYEPHTTLQLNEGGTAFINDGGYEEKGFWSVSGNSITIEFNFYSNIYGNWTDDQLDLFIEGSEFLFTRDLNDAQVIPSAIEATDKSQFIGQWELDYIVQKGIIYSPALFGFTMHITVSEDKALIAYDFDDVDVDNTEYSIALTDGKLALQGTHYYTEWELVLTDSGTVYLTSDDYSYYFKKASDEAAQTAAGSADEDLSGISEGRYTSTKRFIKVLKENDFDYYCYLAKTDDDEDTVYVNMTNESVNGVEFNYTLSIYFRSDEDCMSIRVFDFIAFDASNLEAVSALCLKENSQWMWITFYPDSDNTVTVCHDHMLTNTPADADTMWDLLEIVNVLLTPTYDDFLPYNK